ncbi:hypothetical protein [Deinococcus sp.]|uniref:hypothetical protein n=1 Tax=Deinococcus sp. TaxID=47478 RepID=UPI0025BB6C55|nr:hypothetical protein [Deinococcus sp.]
MPLILQFSDGAPPSGLSGEVVFSARTPPSVRGSVTLTARRPIPISGEASFSASMPTPGVGSSRDIEYVTDLTGLPGQVTTAEYRHAGQYEELTVTVDGLHPLATPTAQIRLQARNGTGALLGELPTRVFSAATQEPQLDTGEGQTTFVFRNSFDHLLRGVRLPELIAWKLNPSPDLCTGGRQERNVSELVRAVMQAHVDGAFRLDDDPLRSSSWVEGRTDYSTLGKTPQQVWDDTYGLLGMALWVAPLDTGIRLVGTWPQPTAPGTGPSISADWRLTDLPQRQWFQTPRRLTLRGAERATPLTPGLLLDLIGPDPARTELERELLPNAEWFEPAESSGTSTVQRGYRKLGGQLVSQVEVTTGDVSVTETVDGQPRVRLLYGVATGYKRTETTYDPVCHGRPVSQRTETRGWGYDLKTPLGTFSVPGPGLNINLQTGDLVANETTLTTYRYSSQGHQTSETTTTRRLASMEQAGADGDLADRGPLTEREYVTQTITQTWAPMGAGRWRYSSGVSGQTLVPVYDAGTREAVRTVALTRSTPDAPRVTDQAPPSYDCRPYCEVIRELLDPTGVVLNAGDAGLAEEREINVPMLRAADLSGVARRVLSADWHREVRTFSVPFPVGYHPGSWLADGRVQGLTIRLGGPDDVVSEITCARLDATLMGPGSAAVEPLRADPNAGRALMLAGAPGGARVRLVTGWDPGVNEAIVEDALVVFRSGYPPRPGDEIEWQLVRGQREATNARR